MEENWTFSTGKDAKRRLVCFLISLQGEINKNGELYTLTGTFQLSKNTPLRTAHTVYPPFRDMFMLKIYLYHLRNNT